jgi:hypothetical protein
MLAAGGRAMTEAKWLVCGDPRPMLDILAGASSVRKWRLFAVESCQLILKVFDYPDLEDAVAFGSTMAEGNDQADWSIFDLVREVVDWGLGEMCETLNNIAMAVEVTIQPHVLSVDDGRRVVESISAAYTEGDPDSTGNNDFCAQAKLLREIFGNPFRPVTFSPQWRTDTALSLARQMYDSRDFSAMPILADALQDAGCDNTDVLDHCRGPRPHVRGCWVCDLVLV